MVSMASVFMTRPWQYSNEVKFLSVLSNGVSSRMIENPVQSIQVAQASHRPCGGLHLGVVFFVDQSGTTRHAR